MLGPVSFLILYNRLNSQVSFSVFDQLAKLSPEGIALRRIRNPQRSIWDQKFIKLVEDTLKGHLLEELGLIQLSKIELTLNLIQELKKHKLPLSYERLEELRKLAIDVIEDSQRSRAMDKNGNVHQLEDVWYPLAGGKLYPQPWLHDSLTIVEMWSYLHPQEAMKSLSFLLDAFSWDSDKARKMGLDGFLAHIAFINDAGNYYPGQNSGGPKS